MQTQAVQAPESHPTIVLRGTGKALEILVDGNASLDEILLRLESQLEQSPQFFQDGDVVVRVSGRSLPAGSLARLEAITIRFGLQIVELTPARTAKKPVEQPAPTPASIPDTARVLIGPVRSGSRMETQGNVVVLGDVNAGAELRTTGNIVVMGALRGLAHAACDGGPGYIVALRLAPQQLRIGTLIARAGDSVDAGTAEIAFAKDGSILVESFRGKLPVGCATT